MLNVKVSESVMAQRAKNRGLADDTSSVIDRRIQNFWKFTIPILEYYQYSHRLLTIDGEQPPEAVAQKIAYQLKSI